MGITYPCYCVSRILEPVLNTPTEEYVLSAKKKSEGHAKEPPCPSVPWFGSLRDGCQRGKKGEEGGDQVAWTQLLVKAM